MFKVIVLVAALLAVAVKSFPAGIYFTESYGVGTYLKYWDPYSGTSTVHRVTNSACAFLSSP